MICLQESDLCAKSEGLGKKSLLHLMQETSSLLGRCRSALVQTAAISAIIGSLFLFSHIVVVN